MPHSDFNFRYKQLLSLGGFFFMLLLIGVLAAHPYVRPALIYDEGFALTNGLRVLRGDLPFLDFWTVYPPGTSHVLAIFFSLLEPSLEVSRWVHLVWIGLMAAFAHLLMTSVANRLIASVTTMLVTAWACLALTPSYSMTPAIALALASLTLLERGWQRDSRIACSVGGLIGGSIVFFRHDLAAYLLLSALVCYVVLLAANSSSCVVNARPLLRRYLGWYAAMGFASLAIILARSGIEPFVDQALLFPSLIQGDQRFLPFPAFMSFWSTSTDPARWLLTWLAPTMLCLALALTGMWRRLLPERTLLVVTITGPLSGLLLLQAFARLDLVHAAPSLIFVAITSSAIGGAVVGKRNVAARASCGFAVAAFSLCSVIQLSNYFHPREAVSCLYNNNCMRTAPDQNAALDFVNRNFAADEPIFVGNRRHDRIHVNDALLYFRMNRPIPTKWNEMHPGEVTTAEVQSQIVEELEGQKVRVAILVDIPSGLERNASAESSQAYVLDTYLSSQFSPVWRQGRYSVLMRRS